MQGSLLDRLAETGRMLTVSEVSELLGVSEKWVYQKAQAGKLPSFRLGLLWRFDPLQLAQWLGKK